MYFVFVALPALWLSWEGPLGKQILFPEAAALPGNWSGGAYWPSTYGAGLPEDDEDPLVVQAYWAHNAAAGLDYVLEHRCGARPAPLPVQGLRAHCQAQMYLQRSSTQRGLSPEGWPLWLPCSVRACALVPLVRCIRNCLSIKIWEP